MWAALKLYSSEPGAVGNMATKHTASVVRISVSSSFAHTISGFDEATAVSDSVLKSNKGTQWLKGNWKRALEVIVLSSAILLVCGLFTIPTILYVLPPLQVRYQ